MRFIVRKVLRWFISGPKLPTGTEDTVFGPKIPETCRFSRSKSTAIRVLFNVNKWIIRIGTPIFFVILEDDDDKICHFIEISFL